MGATFDFRAPRGLSSRFKRLDETLIVLERYTDASVIQQCLHNPQAELEKRCVINTFCNDLLSRLIPKVADGEKLLDENDKEVNECF